MTSVPTVISRPDWVTRRSKGPDTPAARDNIACTARTLLSRSSGRSSCIAFAATVPLLGPSRLSNFDRSKDSGRTISAKYAPSTIPRTTTNVKATMTICPSCLLDKLHVLEEIGGQLDTCRCQPLGALRSDTCRSEPPTDLAISTDAGTLEEENVLHGDDLTLHAGELCNRH